MYNYHVQKMKKRELYDYKEAREHIKIVTRF